MAKTGFCDSIPLLDLHKKVAEERRAPLRALANACGPKERWQPQEGESKGTYQKTEPEARWARRLPVSTDDGIIMGFHEDDSPSHSGGCMEEEAVLIYLHGLQGLYSLQALVPGMLRHETELAMETLGLIYDRSYAWDIFSDMMVGGVIERSQLRFTFPNADLPRPFTYTTRAILVDWLIQVHEVFHFSEETLYLSVHLLNRCLHQIKVNTAKLQLLGVVCLFLAAKKEECLLPEVSELCFLMENGYSNRQLLRMERRVLTELKFELSHCSPLHFLLLSASIAHCSAKVVWMARYLLELSLLEGQCVVFLAAHLAGAALCLSRRVLQEPPTPEGETAWCVASSIHVGSETTLLRIMLIQAGAAARAQSKDTRATFLKYSTAGTMHVSSHPSLLSAPCLLGLPTTHT
ncbi:cyclin N-terminal domain-containing protein 2 isoform X1 [Oncorhynchus keta]|uniref:cyclin N-terminal domain-containing protein 2 isoform X1 n=1 Tax=Oncorhynchus keta TaxID=8018 RepID=UPI0015FCE2E0|nr:cyclin N-terminal domain-containing protein 2 isoform X1 [Oncorhynchus keta]